jgi:hypothetical protein
MPFPVTLYDSDGNEITSLGGGGGGSGDASSANQISQIALETAIRDRLGEVQATPTANTLLDRLKALLTGISLAASTNTIGKLGANSGVDIGDVDVTSVTPGVGAANLGKAEDAAHASGDVGVMVLVVRKDAAGALAGTDGDYAPLQVDASGNLRIALATQLDSTNDSVTAAQGAAGNATAGWFMRFGRPASSGLAEIAINHAASGDNTIVAGVTGQTVRMMKLFLVATAAVTLKVKSGTGTDLTGPISLAAGGSIVLDLDGEPWFTTATGAALTINLSAAVQISGRLYYTQS